MKFWKISVLAFTLAASAMSTNAWADRRHGHGPRVGVYIAPSLLFADPFYSPYYRSSYSYPYYNGYPYAVTYRSAPEVVYVTPQVSAPITYMERSEGQFSNATPVAAQAVAPPAAQQAAPASTNDWFFCRESGKYYPYVQTCPAGWQRVPAQPQQ